MLEIGQQVGNFIIINCHFYENGSKKWIVKCKCGRTFRANSSVLTKIKSCGCHKQKIVKSYNDNVPIDNFLKTLHNYENETIRVKIKQSIE